MYTDMIFVNSFTQARIRKKFYPKKCVNLCMLGPLKDANLGIKPPEFLKYAHYLPKIPSLPKAAQMSLKLH